MPILLHLASSLDLPRYFEQRSQEFTSLRPVFSFLFNLPPSHPFAVSAEKILKEIEGQITSFHDKSKGSLEAIGLLFSESETSLSRLPRHDCIATPVASQPLPPQMICQILKMDEETVRASFEAGNPPRASKEQLVEAIRTSIDPEDDVELYRKVSTRAEEQTAVDVKLRGGKRKEAARSLNPVQVLEKHITRFENTEKVSHPLA